MQIPTTGMFALTDDNETTRRGAETAFFRTMRDVGMLEYTRGGGLKERSNDTQHRKIYATGDALTNENTSHMPMKLAERMACEDSSEAASAAAAVMSRVVVLFGGLHVRMHWLCTIFLLFYGGFLQAIQAALRWKNITRKAIDNFRDSSKLAVLVWLVSSFACW